MLAASASRAVARLAPNPLRRLAPSAPRRRRAARGMAAGRGEPWRANLVDAEADALAIAGAAEVVAVLGIAPESRAGRPAFEVPRALQRDGCRIIPVPCYYPEVTTILGEPVVRDLKAAAARAAAAAAAAVAGGGGAIDVLDVFRRPQDVAAHVPDILAMDPRPRCVWLQSGCGSPQAEEALARAGVRVVSDRCLKVDRAAAAAAAAKPRL